MTRLKPHQANRGTLRIAAVKPDQASTMVDCEGLRKLLWSPPEGTRSLGFEIRAQFRCSIAAVLVGIVASVSWLPHGQAFQLGIAGIESETMRQKGVCDTTGSPCCRVMSKL
ncbi:hypothetical protein BU23DRAFT_165275 [Bimuria novae-zelandiae CBS 107.79]|uniref:Uncharacterized protein n=1 Tax=Bimuria novae-zelandiae CBS 107.79 TaxID=1447943 RepID=A0A6A5V5Z9_9PLEO|nr:hypothetical protein BU23DRAFT_165275 [Bimuria novae-zelandiae CBS 107.79]